MLHLHVVVLALGLFLFCFAGNSKDFSFVFFFFFFCFSSLTLCFFVLRGFYQIEMAIETLQKSEGLSSQRSSLLNSHVSCFFFYKCLPLPNFCLHRALFLLPAFYKLPFSFILLLVVKFLAALEGLWQVSDDCRIADIKFEAVSDFLHVCESFE